MGNKYTTISFYTFCKPRLLYIIIIAQKLLKKFDIEDIHDRIVSLKECFCSVAIDMAIPRSVITWSIVTIGTKGYIS